MSSSKRKSRKNSVKHQNKKSSDTNIIEKISVASSLEEDSSDNKDLTEFFSDQSKGQLILDSLKKLEASGRSYSIEEARRLNCADGFAKARFIAQYSQFDTMDENNHPDQNRDGNETGFMPDYDHMLEDNDTEADEELPSECSDNIINQEGSAIVRSGDDSQSTVPSAPSRSEVYASVDNIHTTQSSPAMMVNTTMINRGEETDPLENAASNREETVVREEINPPPSTSKQIKDKAGEAHQSFTPEYVLTEQQKQDDIREIIRQAEAEVALETWENMIQKLESENPKDDIDLMDVYRISVNSAMFLKASLFEASMQRVARNRQHIIPIITGAISYDLRDCVPDQKHEELHKRMSKIQVSIHDIKTDLDILKKTDNISSSKNELRTTINKPASSDMARRVITTNMSADAKIFEPKSVAVQPKSTDKLSMKERRKLMSSSTNLEASVMRGKAQASMRSNPQEEEDIVDVSRPNSALMSKNSTKDSIKQVKIITHQPLTDMIYELSDLSRDDITTCFPILQNPQLTQAQLSLVSRAAVIANNGNHAGARALIIKDNVSSRRLPDKITDLFRTSSNKTFINLLLQILQINGDIEEV